jgi:hypothetical protein
MATEVEICSAALILLGEAPIASLTETSKRATQAAILWPTARRDILRMHNWNCAMTRVILSPLVSPPAFGYTYQFTKPGDFLRLVQCGEYGETDYVFEANRILSNNSTLKLVYVSDVETGQWDSTLTDLAIKRMASDLAYPVTRSASLKAEMNQEYRMAERAARNIDGQENPPEDWGDSPFIAIRA